MEKSMQDAASFDFDFAKDFKEIELVESQMSAALGLAGCCITINKKN